MRRNNYIKTLIHDIKRLDENQINHIAEMIDESDTIFICGNGGSSSTASHLTNDLQKMCKCRVYCLTDNTPLITAWANDTSYSQIFSSQLSILADHGNTLIVLTSSGNSKNIINAIRFGLSINMKIIALIGNDGGDVLKMFKNDIYIIHTPTDTQHTEDLHLIICHLLTKLLETL